MKKLDDPRDDGRNIDPSRGSLLGEASEQVREPRVPPPTEDPERQESLQSGYYNLPVLKQPVWIWSVPLYFYLGGVAGAASVLQAAADWKGGTQQETLAEISRRIALVSALVGSVLLIIDLGRPARFLNMLRVLRPTSPMSLGSWILTVTSALLTLSEIPSRFSGLEGLRKWASRTAGLAGLPLAGYTGVLLSTTAIPLWQSNSRLLPAMFVASAMSSAASLLQLADLNPREKKVVDRFGLIGEIGETSAMWWMERKAAHQGVGLPLKSGASGTLWRAARILGVCALGAGLFPKSGRVKKIARFILGTAGALALRFSLMSAGKLSARDSSAAFRSQRRLASTLD